MNLQKMIKIIFSLALVCVGSVRPAAIPDRRIAEIVAAALVECRNQIAALKSEIASANKALSDGATQAVSDVVDRLGDSIEEVSARIAASSVDKLGDKLKKDFEYLRQQKAEFDALRQSQKAKADEDAKRELDNIDAKADREAAAAVRNMGTKINGFFAALGGTGANLSEAIDRAGPHMKGIAKIMADTQKEMQKKGHEFKMKEIGAYFNGIGSFVSDKQKMGMLALTIGGSYALVKTIQLAHGQAQKYLETPRIIEKTNVPTFFESLFGRSKVRYPLIKDVMLAQDTRDEVLDVALAIRNTKKNKGKFANYMFWGPSGTGKTMVAEALANDSDCLYVLFTGSAIAALSPKLAIAQINQLFDWAQVQAKPVVIIVDEAEGLLKQRGEAVKEETQQIMTHFMSKIGTPSDKYLVIACTNRPYEFDEAMQTRFPGSIEVALPALEQRLQILESDIKRELQANKIDTSLLSEDKLTEIAARTEGMCGRDLTYLVIDLAHAANAADGRTLTSAIIDRVVEIALKRFNKRKGGFQRTDKPTIGAQALPVAFKK